MPKFTEVEPKTFSEQFMEMIYIGNPCQISCYNKCLDFEPLIPYNWKWISENERILSINNGKTILVQFISDIDMISYMGYNIEEIFKFIKDLP